MKAHQKLDTYFDISYEYQSSMQLIGVLEPFFVIGVGVIIYFTVTFLFGGACEHLK